VDISIVSGWLPVIVEALGLVTLAVGLDRHGGRWRRQLALGAVVATVAVGIGSLVVWVTGAGGQDFPWWPLAWGWAWVLAVVSAVVGWRAPGRLRRSASVAAVVLTLVTTVGAVNARSGTFPTVGRLVDDQPENIVDRPEIRAIQQAVDRTGRLPAQGAVFTTQIPATASGFDTRPATIYLPPAWFAKKTPHLPTLVLLPGEPGSASDWSQQGDADGTADAFAAEHDGVAPIIVMPDPNGLRTVDSECVNSPFGNAQTYLTVDVPAFARQHLDASAGPGSLAVGGLSAGGTCSVMLALDAPDVYPTFASFSGFASPQYEETSHQTTLDTLFGGSQERFDEHDPAYLLAHGRFEGLAGWFEVGSDDAEPLAAAHQLQPLAASAGIATCIAVRPGGHDFDLWTQALQDAFPWIAWHLGLTGEPHHVHATCETP